MLDSLPRAVAAAHIYRALRPSSPSCAQSRVLASASANEGVVLNLNFEHGAPHAEPKNDRKNDAKLKNKAYIGMKLCTACSRELLKDHYSKKQWQLNQRQRRCKECIAGNREVRPVPLPPAGQGAKPEKGPKAKERRASRSSRAEGERGSLSDDDLFKPPLPMLDCPICFLPMPLDSTDSSTKCFYPCCGKTVCMGCVLVYVRQNDHRICPFCRTPEDASNEAAIERMKKRADAGDSDAMYNLGALYYEGQRGVREDPEKAFNLWSSAGRLGCAASNGRIGTAHMMGDCRVEIGRAHV